MRAAVLGRDSSLDSFLSREWYCFLADRKVAVIWDSICEAPLSCKTEVSRISENEIYIAARSNAYYRWCYLQ